MATYNVELNSKPKRNGQHLILIRITQKRKHRRISLERSVLEKEFNPKAKYGHWIRTSNPDHKRINELIKDRIRELEATEMQSKSDPIVSQSIDTKQQSQVTLTEYWNREVLKHRNQNQFATARRKKSILDKVVKFLGFGEINFDDITTDFLNDYEKYWLENGNKINTVHGNLKVIRAVLRSALLEGLCDTDPFTRIKLKSERVEREKLDETEIQSLADLDLIPNSREWHIRNLYLFSYYTAGMRFGDVIQIKWSQVGPDHLTYPMRKNKEVHSVLLTAKAHAILSLYKDQNTNQDHFVFPFLRNDRDYSDKEYLFKQIMAKNAMVNGPLKEIMSRAGILKDVSFHTSRHSFAYCAVRKSGDVYSVSKSLHHSNLSTTEVYLKQFDTSASDELLRKMFD